MSSSQQDSLRTFQLKRVILFRNAVFAIAITLLIIEIRVPSMHDGIASEADLLRSVIWLPSFSDF